jgi:hypothetical protein
MTLQRIVLASWVIPVLGLGACGDNGGSTDSESQGTSTTVTTPSGPTTNEPTTSTSSVPTTSTTDDSGTMSNSAGMTTTTGDPTTSTSASTSTGTTENVTATESGTSTSTGTTDDTTEGTSTSTTGLPCQPGDTQGMGDVEKSYLWVANSDEGTVSKVNTMTMVEEARYRTGPNGGGYAEDPSRTAVSLDGRFVVVNNRNSGRSTVIAANLEDCTDNNGNGMIDTSANKGDIRAWGADECMKWSVVHPFNNTQTGGPRGVTWTPGIFNEDTCEFEDPAVWIGYLPPQFGTAHMARLDGDDGTVEETVVINNWVVGDTSWGPYGAALDKELNVWFTGLRGELFRINTANNPATLDRWNPGFETQSYGMTVDPDGDPWMAGCAGPVTTFDPDTNQFIAVPGTDNGSCYRGIGADRDGSVWVASNGQCGVMQIDHKTNTMIQFHNLAPCNTPVMSEYV